MKTILLSCSILLGLTVRAAVPCVSDVQLTPYGKAKITYTLSEAPGIVTFDILTNGVSIGAQFLTNAVGDVNRVVQPGPRTISWNATEIWPGHKFKTPCVTAKVTAWPLSAPPDWLAVDLTNADYPVTYYTSEAALPWGGISANKKYKGDIMLFRKIPASHVLSFMGSPESEANRIAGRETRRMCTLTNDYFMAIYPMTYRQYYLLDNSESTETRLTPVKNQSYNMLRYAINNTDNRALPINWPKTGRNTIGESSQLKPWREKTGLLLDLPTSAQWEYACRAGTDTPLYWGDGSMSNLSKICKTGNSPVYEVGTYECNKWMLYDMIGNVNEWCLDHYEENITSEAVTDPVGPMLESSYTRKIRGYHANDIHKRAAFYTSQNYTAQNDVYAFRLCVTLP